MCCQFPLSIEQARKNYRFRRFDCAITTGSRQICKTCCKKNAQSEVIGGYKARDGSLALEAPSGLRGGASSAVSLRRDCIIDMTQLICGAGQMRRSTAWHFGRVHAV
jgi:hypothetical protein